MYFPKNGINIHDTEVEHVVSEKCNNHYLEVLKLDLIFLLSYLAEFLHVEYFVDDA